MQENSPNDKVICHCSGTTQLQILKLIQNGADSLEQISRATGTAAGCGACETWVEELLLAQNQPRIKS